MTPHLDLRYTVDGRNPAPVDTVNISLFAGFHAFQVVHDFFHQEYFFFGWQQKPGLVLICKLGEIISHLEGFPTRIGSMGLVYLLILP